MKALNGKKTWIGLGLLAVSAAYGWIHTDPACASSLGHALADFLDDAGVGGGVVLTALGMLHKAEKATLEA